MAADSCATHAGERRNTFTVGNGHHPEGNLGDVGGPGNRFLPWVSGTGGRRAVPGRPGDRPVWCGKAGGGPLHLIHGGGLVPCGGAAVRLPEKYGPGSG